MKKSIKKILIIAAVAIVIVGGVLGYNAYKSNKDLQAQFEGNPSTASAAVGDIELYISVSGNISTADHVKVESDTIGQISAVNYEVGDKVEAGDVLAEVSDEVLTDEIEALEKQIFDLTLSIDKSKLSNDTYYIKSSVEGRTKDIKAEYDDDVEDIIDEYGYLALISLEDKMYVKMSKDLDKYTKDMEVKVKCEGYYYDGIVEKVDGDAAWIVIDTAYRTVGASGYVYAKDWEYLGKGYAELYDFIEVTAHSGTVKEVYTYENETLSFNEQLFKTSAYPQALIDMYDDLNDLKEQLEEKQTMLESLMIKAPVSGFVTAINIAKGDTITNEDMVVYTLADTSTWIATVAVDELDVNDVLPGQPVDITADALSDEVFNGTVKEISSVGTASGGITTYDVKIEVPADEQFKLAMSVTGEILIKSVQSAVTVPVEAVREMGDRSYVVVYVKRSEEEVEAIKQSIINAQEQASSIAAMSNEERQEMIEQKRAQRGDAAGKGGSDSSMVQGMKVSIGAATMSTLDQLYGEMRVVEVGLKNETLAEIISGLEEGEVVILPGIDSSSSSQGQQSFGMPGMGMGGAGRAAGGGSKAN